jgi:hypothetical protein
MKVYKKDIIVVDIRLNINNDKNKKYFIMIKTN